MGGDAIPEMGKTVGGEVLKSRLQFWPFPQRDVKWASAISAWTLGSSQGWDVDFIVIGMGWQAEPWASMRSPGRIRISRKACKFQVWRRRLQQRKLTKVREGISKGGRQVDTDKGRAANHKGTVWD